ncbi:hypothetical protein AB0C10_36525 [Microbispora amethystogenes]|uniref:hypothetical protein n=1 Tax=Microbispora amethystogenes TaxID=1427754 RepID=UPI0033C32AC7
MSSHRRRTISRTLTALAAGGLLVGAGGAGYAVAATQAPTVVGACANTKTKGALRLMEPKNLSKSRWGKCGTGEVKVELATSVAKGPKGDRGPAGPAADTLVFQRATGTETCTRSASSTASTVVYACTTATPSPSPSAPATPSP